MNTASSNWIGQGLILLLLSLGAGSAPAQTQDRLIQPELFDTAAITAMASLPDGSVVVSGGSINFLNGLPIDSDLVRLNPDGSPDTDWPIRLRGVSALAAAADGSLLVAGNFQEVAGTPRRGLARLSAEGALLPWALQPDSGEPELFQVSQVLELPGGDLLLAAIPADFTGPLLLRADAATGVYRSLYRYNGFLVDLELLGDGSVIIAGGPFFSFDGIGGEYLIRLLPGSLQRDVAFPNAAPFGTSAVASDRMGGFYLSIGGQLRRLSAAGVVDSGVALSADGDIRRIEVDTLGRIYLLGAFSTIGGQPHAGLARLPPGSVGQTDPTWAPPTYSGELQTLEVGENRVLVGGWVVSSGHQASGLLALDTVDGARPADFNPPLFGARRITDTVVSVGTADGGAVLAGQFTHTADEIFNRLIKIDADAQPVSGWSNDGVGWALRMIDGGDGNLYFYTLTLPNNILRPRLRRISIESAQLDPAWIVETAGPRPKALAVADGHLFVASFPDGASTSPRVTKVSRISLATGAELDPSWEQIPGAPVMTRRLLPLPSGEVLAVGDPVRPFIPGDPPPPAPDAPSVFRFHPSLGAPQSLGPDLPETRRLMDAARLESGELVLATSDDVLPGPEYRLLRLASSGEVISDAQINSDPLLLLSRPLALDSAEQFLYVAGVLVHQLPPFPPLEWISFLGRIDLSTGQLDPRWRPVAPAEMRWNSVSVDSGRVFVGGTGDQAIGGFFSTEVPIQLFDDGFEAE